MDREMEREMRLDRIKFLWERMENFGASNLIDN